MPDEDQERVEDYLELERYIEELQAGRVAHLPENMTPEQARIYRMAALFRTATPEADAPHSIFAAQLEARLLSQLPTPAQGDTPQEVINSPLDENQHTVPSRLLGPEPSSEQHPTPSIRSNAPRKRTTFSRRNLLAGAAAAAASLGIGAGVEYTREHMEGAGSKQVGTVKPFTWDPATPLVGKSPTMWLPVTSLAQLGNGAVRFATDTVVGYVVHLVKDEEYPDEIIAVSGACTHMGCLVHWQNADRRFHCPCHNGLFEASGEQVNSPGYAHYLAPLPRLKTKVENGHVYVEVPAPQQKQH